MTTTNLVQASTESRLETETITVVFAADNNYSMPLAVTMRSILETLKSDRKVQFFVIDGGIKEQNKRRVLKSLNSAMLTSGQCELHWIPSPESLNDSFVISEHLPNLKMQHLPNATYYRLLIPDLLPQHIKKVIYMDCDVVVNHSLETLWNIEIQDNYLLATTNEIHPSVSHPEGLLNWKELGFAPDDKKFTAGVLVLNLEQWRADHLCAKALTYLEHNLHYIRWHDSDVLHAVVKTQWGSVDRRWNVFEPRFLPQSEIDDAFIVHYTSPEKPWVAIEKNPASELFFYYLRMTDWASYKHTVPQRLWRRLKREYRNLKARFK